MYNSYVVEALPGLKGRSGSYHLFVKLCLLIFALPDQIVMFGECGETRDIILGRNLRFLPYLLAGKPRFPCTLSSNRKYRYSIVFYLSSFACSSSHFRIRL